MEVIWTQEALERLEDIRYYLAVKQHAPVVARDMIDKLLARAPQIQDMPLSGRQVPDYHDPNVREQLKTLTASSTKLAITWCTSSV
ncbi:MAG: type II toxin-antitoxin system RelE/ParE family toxin [Pseudomonadota bacterium]